MPNTSHNSSLLPQLMFREKYTLDLFRLIFWPDSSQKESRVSLTLVQFFISAFANKTRSSAKKRREKASPLLDALTRSYNFSSHFPEIRKPSISIHIMNKQGERGSPCLIPLEGRKGSSLPPLKRIDTEELEMQLMISLIIEGGN